MLVATAIGNAQAREELGMLVDEQAALRRVAILIARGEPAAAAFAAVADGLGRMFGAEATGVNRYEVDGAVTSVGSWNSVGPVVPAGSRLRPRRPQRDHACVRDGTGRASRPLHP